MIDLTQYNLSDLSDITLFENSPMAWGMMIVIAIVAFIVMKVLQKIILDRLINLSKKVHVVWPSYALDALKKTHSLAVLVFALYFGSQALELSAEHEIFVSRIVLTVFWFQAGLWMITFVTAWLDNYRNRQMTENPAAVTTLNALGIVIKIFIWLAIFLLILDNFGVDITALIAGLGVGGIAVALAVQNILGDLFASLTIALDKPFVVGDFLIVDDKMGSVENVGLKTTRIRSLSGEQLIFSNSDLLSSRLRNFGRMFRRRVPFVIGVTYQTPREKLKKIPGIIKAAIEAQEKTTFDRSHFQKYGDFSLDFESVYFVEAADYNIYMDINQEINFQIHEEFEKEGIEFAYPTQTLFIESDEGEGDAPKAKPKKASAKKKKA